MQDARFGFSCFIFFDACNCVNKNGKKEGKKEERMGGKKEKRKKRRKQRRIDR